MALRVAREDHRRSAPATASGAAAARALRLCARHAEARSVGPDDRWLGQRLARAVDHRDRLRVERLESERLTVAHRARATEAQRAEVIERDHPAAGARRLLHPLGGGAA